MDDRRHFMKEFSKFNIDITNSDGLLLIHYILSIIKPITFAIIINMKINLGKTKLKYFVNGVSLENEQAKGCM